MTSCRTQVYAVLFYMACLSTLAKCSEPLELTQELMVGQQEKLNFDFSDISPDKSLKFDFDSDVKDLKTNLFNSVSESDLKSLFGLDIEDLSTVSSFQGQQGNFYIVIEKTLSILFKGQESAVEISKCERVFVSNDFIFCLDLTDMNKVGVRTIKMTCYKNSLAIRVVGRTDIISDSDVTFVKMFSDFKNMDDGMILVLINDSQKTGTEEDRFERVKMAAKGSDRLYSNVKMSNPHVLNYYLFERNNRVFYQELGFPEATVLETNYINHQMMFISPKFITTNDVKTKSSNVSYVYSFYEETLDYCNFDNSDATNMILLCLTSTPDKLLRFFFLKSNFQINSLDVFKLKSGETNPIISQIVKFKYILELRQDSLTVFKTSDFLFHSFLAPPPDIDFANSLLDFDPMSEALYLLGKGSKLTTVSLFSRIQATCDSFSAGTRVELRVSDLNSQNLIRKQKYNLMEVSSEPEFQVLYQQPNLDDLKIYSKNLIFPVERDLVLGKNVQIEFEMKSAEGERGEWGENVQKYQKLDTDYDFLFNTEFNPALSEFTHFLYSVMFVFSDGFTERNIIIKERVT